MPDLHLIGVHEDGRRLLLSGPGRHGGEEYTLPIDDALRAVLRREYTAHRSSSEPMRPTEVQAMIRAGASAQEAAERAGWPVEKVHRYEGPILAERAHIARIAGDAHVPSHTGNPVSLLDRVEERLDQRGVVGEDVEWDSWRSEDGQWTVELTFPAGGRRRLAAWHFSRSSMTVSPVDDEARWLSGEDAPDAPQATRPRAGGTTLPPARRNDNTGYDTPAPPAGEQRSPEPEREPVPTPAASGHRGAPDPDSELTAGLRERAAQRGRRRPRRLPRPAGLHSAPGPALGTAASRTTQTTPTALGPTLFAGPSPTAIPDVGMAPDPDAVPLEPLDYDPTRDGLPPAAHAEPIEEADARPEPAATDLPTDLPIARATLARVEEVRAEGEARQAGEPIEVVGEVESIEAVEAVEVVDVIDAVEIAHAEVVEDDVAAPGETPGADRAEAFEAFEAPEVPHALDAVEPHEAPQAGEAVIEPVGDVDEREAQPRADSRGDSQADAQAPAIEQTPQPLALERSGDAHTEQAGGAGNVPTHTEPELSLGGDAPPPADVAQADAEHPAADKAPPSGIPGDDKSAAPAPAPAPRTRRRTRSAAPGRRPATGSVAEPRDLGDESSRRNEQPAPDPAAAKAAAPTSAAPRTGRQGQGGTRQSGRKGRASVPAWDDVMFGAKPPAE